MKYEERTIGRSKIGLNIIYTRFFMSETKTVVLILRTIIFKVEGINFLNRNKVSTHPKNVHISTAMSRIYIFCNPKHPP